jgi:hypothetical protein
VIESSFTPRQLIELSQASIHFRNQFRNFIGLSQEDLNALAGSSRAMYNILRGRTRPV